MARFLLIVQVAGCLVLLASLSTIFVTEVHRLRMHNERLRKELSALHKSLHSFSKESRLRHVASKDNPLPPLNTFIDEEGHVIGDPQILLQFAVIGFGKCGTSSLMRWLETHPSLQMLHEEVWALTGKDPARLIRRLHKKLTDPDKLRGYKCPGDVLAYFIMDYYRKYWPKTKLFVGVRHAVLWYQSLYNFRVQNFEDFEQLPHPNELIGACPRTWTLLCMGRGFFGYHLLKLHKHHWERSNAMIQLENQLLELMGIENLIKVRRHEPMPNDIFFFEIQQLSDENITRHDQFKNDVQEFLRLTEPLPDMLHYRPGKEWNDDELQRRKDAKKIDICQDQFIPTRRVLMLMSRLSSEWIRTVFLESPGVFVSSKEYIRHILATEWMEDPCKGPATDKVTEQELDRILRNTTGKSIDDIDPLARLRILRSGF